jgi:SAM-dependent methyltransferase
MPQLPAASDTALSTFAAPHLPWPTPALLVWLAAWGGALVLRPLVAELGGSAAWAWGAATALGVGLALVPRLASHWRRLFMAAGFPVSALASGLAGAVPAWVWLLPLGLLLAAYPLRAWRDAPLFPTPVNGLDGLAQVLPLAAGARVMDAGCGLGHGLSALRRCYPQAQIEGVEFSWPLRAAAALRCPWALVRRGDMWAADWSGLALVYLFQRPESMARALAKADAELGPGGWLVSLDFPVPDVVPAQVLRRPGAQPVWIYRTAEPRLATTGPGSIPASPGR